MVTSMRRNKVGVMLISLQIAVTLAILCNGLFIIHLRLILSSRPTGTDESNIFVIANEWVGETPDLSARLATDLVTLRSIPGVIDAYSTNAYPLTNNGRPEGVRKGAEPGHNTLAAVYFADEHGMRTLGLKLIEGRNFTSSEVADLNSNDVKAPPSVIITRALSDKLFPDGGALGKSMYLDIERHSTAIVGIVDTLQAPWTEGSPQLSTSSGNSIIEPFRYAARSTYYIVRTQPWAFAGVLHSAQQKLVDGSPVRVIQKVQPLAAARVEAYRDDRGLAVILGIVCILLLIVTALGIVGLTSYWVAQRQRQIGIRRALGATRSAIVQYFQTENLLISSAGVIFGVALAIALNTWMVRNFEMVRLRIEFPIAGAAIVLLLGQLAALWPALRAASLPPTLAIRTG
jgi:putative ABC transport system permease protein